MWFSGKGGVKALHLYHTQKRTDVPAWNVCFFVFFYFLGEGEGFWGVVWEGLCGGIFGDGLGWFVRRRGAAPFGGAESHARSAWSPPQAGGLRPVAAACRGRREKQNSHPRRGNGCGDYWRVRLGRFVRREGRSPFRRSRKPRAKRVEPACGGRAAPGGCGLQGAAGKAKQPSPVREWLR